MKSDVRSILLAAALGWLATSATAKDTPPGAAAGAEALVEANNRFAIDLYARLRKRPDNLCFSPFGLFNALSMTQAGARGETARQLARVLHLPGDDRGDGHAPASNALHLELLNAGADSGDVRLESANSIWGPAGLGLVPSFLDQLRRHYHAEVREVDFRGDPDAARKAINAWVSIQTQRKIEELLKPDEVDDQTQLVLVNTVCFQGAWAVPFRKERTRPATFQVSWDRQVEAPFMELAGTFRAGGMADAEVLELPYAGRDLGLIILLPHRPNGLADLERRLTAASLAEALRRLKPQSLAVSLPRFAFKAEVPLARVLADMGAPLAFRHGAADFSGLGTHARHLAISDIAHQVDLKVDEQGTEAVAATATRVARGLAGLSAREFRANHPFLFLLRDHRTGLILFLGRLNHPGA